MPAPLTEHELAAAGRALLRLVETPGPLETPCWIWPGARTKDGYGGISVGINPNRTTVSVHRLLYRVLVGEPPPRLHLHHRCDIPACGNPGHLSPLTVAEHIRISGSPAGARARQTHCIRNHPLSGANLGRSGTRRCLTCHRERESRRRLALAA